MTLAVGLPHTPFIMLKYVPFNPYIYHGLCKGKIEQFLYLGILITFITFLGLYMLKYYCIMGIKLT